MPAETETEISADGCDRRFSSLAFRLSSPGFGLPDPDGRPGGQILPPTRALPAEPGRSDDSNHGERLQDRPEDSLSGQFGESLGLDSNSPHVLDDPVPRVSLERPPDARGGDRSFQKERCRPSGSDGAFGAAAGPGRQMRDQTRDRRVEDSIGSSPEQPPGRLSQEAAVSSDDPARGAKEDLGRSPAGAEKTRQRKRPQSPAGKPPAEPGRGGPRVSHGRRDDGDAVLVHSGSLDSYRTRAGTAGVPNLSRRFSIIFPGGGTAGKMRARP